MTDKIWDHIKNGRENVPVPGKSQYVTDEFIFTCPRCNETISSVHYLNIGYFQLAAEEHLAECSKKVKKTEIEACKTGFFYQKSRYDEKTKEYVFTLVILGPDRDQLRELPEQSGGYNTLFEELYALSMAEKTFFRECDGWSVSAAERTIFPHIPIIDADQDQRDQLTTRLSLRREEK